MAAYAVLGSTGNTGTAIISHLLKRPSAKIHAFCRNKAKLLRLLPEVEGNSQVEIFEGGIQDIQLLASCVKDCRAVFLCITTNDNLPGCSLNQDCAAAVIRALESIKQSPKVVLLSSATVDDTLSRHLPWILRQILFRSASNVYADLIAAEKLLRAQDSWLTSIFIKPGALSLDIQRGHALSFTEESSPISYLDLAAGMLEAVDDETELYINKNVSVINTNGNAKFPTGTPMCILMGLISHFFPSLHGYLPNTGPG